MSELTKKQREEINQKIDWLRTQFSGELFHDADIRNQIHNLEMKLSGVKPASSEIDCEGCGS